MSGACTAETDLTQIPLNNSKQAVSGASNSFTTPQKAPAVQQRENDLENRDELRKCYAQDLAGYGTTPSFMKLMNVLRLESLYTKYSEEVSVDTFYNIAETIPSVCETLSGGRHSIAETEFVRTFKSVLANLSESPHLAGAPEYSKTPYTLVDCQNEPVGGSSIKPDLAFFDWTGVEDITTARFFLEAKKHMSLESALSKHLGQLADYAMHLRKHQPLRTFEPIFLLLGCELYLVVFTHAGYMATDLGPVMFAGTLNIGACVDDVAQSLRDLWFLLTLPADKFGFLDGASGIHEYLHLDWRTSPATLKVATKAYPTNIEIKGQMLQRLPTRGRCAYLFEVLYKGGKAVLKLSWANAKRLPEGAIYDVLAVKGVTGIPKVHASGVLDPDMDGYRLEFLLMEHCGVRITDYFDRLRQAGAAADKVAKAAKDCVASVTLTLAQARAAGVLHRDISAGNIAVNSGRAAVIDWGYGKVLHPPEDRADDIAQRWGIEWSTVIGEEAAHDPFTGTPLYMSVQMLFGVAERGVFNDIESLLYVILDAFSERKRAAGVEMQPPGFAFNASEVIGLARVGAMSSDKKWLTHFKVRLENMSATTALLSAMRKFLYYEGDRFIGGELQDSYQRTIDPTAALEFMCPKALELLQSLHDEPQQPATHSPQQAHSTEPALAESTPAPAAMAPPPRFTLGPAGQLSTGRQGDDISESRADENKPPLLGTESVPNSPTPAAYVAKRKIAGSKKAAKPPVAGNLLPTRLPRPNTRTRRALGQLSAEPSSSRAALPTCRPVTRSHTISSGDGSGSGNGSSGQSQNKEPNIAAGRLTKRRKR
ncbi:hypothetical protein GGI04_002794 [Coemansia thaxteri]|nr:hypothetical protein GGI04_002794 [Coemansia thaxteri]